MREIWKDIKGFEGKYQISNCGRVKSLKRSGRKLEKILILTLGKRGYWTIGLYNKQKVKRRPIHRLIAETFIPNPLNKREVNHKDSDKLNNKIENLEWVTPSENSKHAVKSLGSKKFFHVRGAYKIMYKNKIKWDAQIRIDGRTNRLGTFHKKKDAILAYQKAYIKNYGFAPWDRKA